MPRPGQARSLPARGFERVAEALVGDIGGTHARFAIAARGSDGRVRLEHGARLRVDDFPGPVEALRAYGADLGRTFPAVAVLAVATDCQREPIRLTNNGWAFDQGEIARSGSFDRLHLVNDFEAVAEAVGEEGAGVCQLFGPAAAADPVLPATILGPGTGLGAALLLEGRCVLATEAGHIGFAPRDEVEDRLLAALRPRFGRVSVERLVSGPGLGLIAEAMGGPAGHANDAELWASELAAARPGPLLDRWLSMLGAVAGDLVLAHGSRSLVLAGTLIGRVGARIAEGSFWPALCAKGRFADRLCATPVFRLDCAEPGLMGAAAIALKARREPAA